MERNIYKIGKELFITSDEEIKEGDYVVQINFEKTNTQVIKCETEFQTEIANDKDGSYTKNKIILTTDQDLIKDGIQAIDDEFLEWFVKNPSCEEVEVTYDKDVFPYGVETAKGYGWYKIIIPQEEPKQERRYSEKDMREAFIAGGNSCIEEDDVYGSLYDAYMEDWFEQFKKK
jgi:hypothetical protein